MLDLLHSIYVRIHEISIPIFHPCLWVAVDVRALVQESAAGDQKTQNLHEKQEEVAQCFF